MQCILHSVFRPVKQKSRPAGIDNSWQAELVITPHECFLYYVKLETNHGTFYKIGISVDPENRIKAFDYNKATMLFKKLYNTTEEAYNVEWGIKVKFRNHLHKGKRVLGTVGNTALFTIDILPDILNDL